MVATGMISSSTVMVDVCARSKGVDYLSCLMFSWSFPFSVALDVEGRKKAKPEDRAVIAACFLTPPWQVKNGSEAGNTALLCVYPEQTIWV